ncbi:flagellar hook-basal body complex protein FliE [Trinickia terrae]|uniref:Flagellar hook-basal body complex protein FliE n=1 Tax=Trinickia terrae TaxID=2571161 RepID=A0A4U1I7R0_9BURK|nr:flagellar hook-basal body complex protein FliE [Trinickia terrae]TKC89461.1 flagellar hook-basal body complex protein FliE [Trinickia terrae]
MSIEAINAVQPGFLPPTWASGLAQHTPESFGSMLVSGWQSADRALQSADTAVADFTLGKDLPPHQVMLALEEARMQMQFALQVRSRLVEGYQELMRMQL